MAQYISKSALVAEINNLIDKGKHHDNYQSAFRDGNNSALYALKRRIDILEMKDVDSNDVFVEKACEWIMNHFSSEGFGSPLYYKGLLYRPEDIVEDFKKDMKGE